LIKLALPNRTPAVELAIGQPQYCQPSVISPPFTRQRGRLQKDQRPQHARPAISPPARIPVTIHKVPLNFTNCVACPSFKKTQCVRPGN